VFLFEIPAKGNNIVLVNKILDRNLSNGITDLVSEANLLFGSDGLGNIVGWCIRSADNPKTLFNIRGNSKFDLQFNSIHFFYFTIFFNN
jgi:hypothetical protein